LLIVACRRLPRTPSRWAHSPPRLHPRGFEARRFSSAAQRSAPLRPGLSFRPRLDLDPSGRLRLSPSTSSCLTSIGRLSLFSLQLFPQASAASGSATSPPRLSLSPSAPRLGLVTSASSPQALDSASRPHLFLPQPPTYTLRLLDSASHARQAPHAQPSAAQAPRPSAFFRPHPRV